MIIIGRGSRDYFPTDSSFIGWNLIACHSCDPIMRTEIYPNFQSTERSIIPAYDSFDQTGPIATKIDRVPSELPTTIASDEFILPCSPVQIYMEIHSPCAHAPLCVLMNIFTNISYLQVKLMHCINYVASTITYILMNILS